MYNGIFAGFNFGMTGRPAAAPPPPPPPMGSMGSMSPFANSWDNQQDNIPVATPPFAYNQNYYSQCDLSAFSLPGSEDIAQYQSMVPLVAEASYEDQHPEWMKEQMSSIYAVKQETSGAEHARDNVHPMTITSEYQSATVAVPALQDIHEQDEPSLKAGKAKKTRVDKSKQGSKTAVRRKRGHSAAILVQSEQPCTVTTDGTVLSSAAAGDGLQTSSEDAKSADIDGGNGPVEPRPKRVRGRALLRQLPTFVLPNSRVGQLVRASNASCAIESREDEYAVFLSDVDKIREAFCHSSGIPDECSRIDMVVAMLDLLLSQEDDFNRCMPGLRCDELTMVAQAHTQLRQLFQNLIWSSALHIIADDGRRAAAISMLQNTQTRPATATPLPAPQSVATSNPLAQASFTATAADRQLEDDDEEETSV